MAKQTGKDKEGETSKINQNSTAQSTQANVSSWIREVRPKKISYSYGGISDIIDRAYNSGVYMNLKDSVGSEKLRCQRQAPAPITDASAKHCCQHDPSTLLKEGALNAYYLSSGEVEVQKDNATPTRVFNSSPVTEEKDDKSKTADILSIKSSNSVVFNTTRNELPNASQNREGAESNLSIFSVRSWKTAEATVPVAGESFTSDKGITLNNDSESHKASFDGLNSRVSGRRQIHWQEVKSNGWKNLQLLKLTFFACVPALIVIGQNIASLKEDVQVMTSMDKLKENVQFSLEVAKIIHHIQIERGTTALYVTSGGDQLVKQRLSLLYQNTDASVDVLANTGPDYKLEQIGSEMNLHDRIKGFRSSLDINNITLRDVIVFYTDINTALSTTIGLNINLEIAFTYWTELTAFQLLLIGKEQAGIERALGSTYFARGELPQNDLLWYNEKAMLGVYFLSQSSQYSANIDSNMKNLLQQTQLATDISRMREEIRENAPISPSVNRGTIWFDNMTEYINILKSIQDDLAAHIVKYADKESGRLESRLIASTLQLCIVAIMIPIIVYLLKNIAKITNALGKRTVELTQEKWQTETLLIKLEDERKRTEELLYELLPKPVALKLMRSGNAMPETFSSVTIMFSDVVDFTRISRAQILHVCINEKNLLKINMDDNQDAVNCITPIQVVDMLNKLYRIIDGRIENFDVYKVETIGDGYMVASGLPKRNGFRHVEEIAKLAIDLLDSLKGFKYLDALNQNIQLRIGFHTGPCAAGVVGIKMPRYCIFGDTVNTASRMESTSLPMRIQMTDSSAMILTQKTEFRIKERGKIEVKGKGLMQTFWLEGLEHQENVLDCK